MITLEQLSQLQTPEGSRLLAELREITPYAPVSIAIATRLRKTCPADLTIAAITIHDLRLKARAKFSRADEMWFTRDGLEQATSEAVANWRAQRYREFPEIVDLCCGIGGDLLALAFGTPGATLTAVDRDPLHLAMARLNAAALGIADRMEFIQRDVREVEPGEPVAAFIDPARRSERGRMTLGESEPPLEWCVALANGHRAVGVKCAPGLDRARIPEEWEFEAIAIGTDLKEAMLWSPRVAQAINSATVIEGETVHQLRPVAGDPVAVRTPKTGDTLLDPNPAVTRAGLVEDLARTTGASKIDDRIGFLVSENWGSTAFARSLRVVESLPWNQRALNTRLRELGAGPVDIRRRGLAGDVDAIAKRLRGKGDRPFTIAMTRVMDQPWAIVCEEWPKIEQNTGGRRHID